MNRTAMLLLCLTAVVATTGLAREPGFAERRALMDSLRGVPPKQREWWLRKRGIEFPCYTAGEMSDSGLRLVGKWGRGPAVEVTGEDTLVVLTLGSEVALFGFADPDHPHLLSEIQFNSLTGQSQLAGALLYVSSGRSFEVWDVTEPRNPVRRGSLPYGIGDFRVNDSFLYFIKADTFKVFSVANPAAMYQLGACRDSVHFLCAAGGTAVVGDPDYGLYFLDITDPRNPRHAGSFATDIPRSAEVRGNLCCATVDDDDGPYRFLTLDISNLSSPRQLGSLRDAGGHDLFLDGPLVFATGKPFHIISITDSARPSRIGQLHLPGSYNNGVWADWTTDRAYVANDDDGLAVVDIYDLGNPQRDTSMLGACWAVDIEVRGQRCYVANLSGGLKILDVSDPTQPTMLGELDTVGGVQTCYSVAVDDSFAYGGWFNAPFFRVADVRDPARPEFVGWCDPFEYAQDMVLRDTLLYCADCYQFEVINVARPREPVVVGTCNMVAGEQWGLVLQDTFAYCGSWDGLSIVNISRPTAPQLISQTSGTRLTTCGVAVRDTLAFVPSVYETLWVYNVANPTAPYPIAGAPLGGDHGIDAAILDDSTVFVGCSHTVCLVNVSDPAHPRMVGSYPAPGWVRHVRCFPPYLYVCTDAGVMVLETTAAGFQEPDRVANPQPPLRMAPNPASEFVRVVFGGPLRGGGRLSLYDASGRRVLERPIRKEVNEAELNLTTLSPGLYFVRIETNIGVLESKIVKR